MAQEYQIGKERVGKIGKKSKPGSALERDHEHIVPIVGIGASAGGLNALKKFFSNTPENGGTAYIVIVHMAPDKPSLMPELLQKTTQLKVIEARDGDWIQPDHIYVNPPNREISLYQGRIQLLDMIPKGLNLPIDFFLKSLAKERGYRSAAVILSGTGSDGTSGAKEVNAHGGLVLAQSKDSAEYDGMPGSVIKTGLVDWVLPPEEMPERLVGYFSHYQAKFKSKLIPLPDSDHQQNWLNRIFAILRVQVGHDFSGYKTTTLLRRLSRRMGLNQINNLEHYACFMKENPSEVKALFRELLIGVTHFFRDPESFEHLKHKIFPEIFRQVEAGTRFRVWVPGCSTGEEIYSLAIVLNEYLDTIAKRVNLQLFGTDIDEHAIEKAREGVFPANISADVSQERLSRFFNKEGNFFRVGRAIRDCVVFSVQDLLMDPPFSRLNLLCCRNLLIYLDRNTQKKIFPLFHYTLVPNGVLMLGASESIGGFSNLFDIRDKKWKIYQRQEVPRALRQNVEFPSGPDVPGPDGSSLSFSPLARKNDIGILTQQVVLDLYGPTALLIDKNGQILHVIGRTGKYLETTTGPPTQNVLDMAREGLRLELSAAIRKAKTDNRQVVRENICIQSDREAIRVRLHVQPLHTPEELAGRFIVLFEALVGGDHSDQSLSETKQGKESLKISALERELLNTRESHQTAVEELESSNEELKSTNEELQSSNEELQSTNEELESSKEELQSLNEELQTVNSELQTKVDELSAARDDMHNLLNSTEIATIFVDNEMCIRRYTPRATAIINLIPADIGRPLRHVVSNLAYKEMIADLEAVLEQLVTKETEVRTEEGKWYKMRIMLYCTRDNRIDGAVLTFVDIDSQKKSQETLERIQTDFMEKEERLRLIFELSDSGIFEIDRKLRIIYTNEKYARIFGYQPKEMIGMNWNAFLDIGEKKRFALFQKKLLKGERIKEEMVGIHKKGQKIFVRVHAGPVFKKTTVTGIIGTLNLGDIPKGGLADE